MSPTRSIIQSAPPPFRQQQAPSVRRTGTKKGEERQRERGMERQEEGRMRAYIKAVFSDICALGVESHYEYQYEPMERKHSLFFFFPSSSSSHWAIHAHKKSIQVNVMANLWACAWLCEQCSLGSTSSLSLSLSLALLSWVWPGLYRWKTLYVKCNCGEHYNM